jgi:3-oxoacyl-[acyl-carrier protein] reductase
MNRRLEGKVAIVTGSGRGIGRAVALKLASDGAKIVINDLDAAMAQSVAAEITALGSEAAICAGSVTAGDFAKRFIDTALTAFGDIHIIVNNAGYTWDSVIQKMTDEQWNAMIDVHLTAPFRILRAATDHIRSASKREAAEGRRVVRKVVNISSLTGIDGNAGQVNYAAAKAGINGVTLTLSKEWGRYQVTVNSVAFALIKTRLTEASADSDASIHVEGKQIKVGVNPDLLVEFERSIPLGRAGTPEDAAGAIYLFCIPESDYISGQILLCSGGF